VYKPEKKYNIPKRTTIGKRCEDRQDGKSIEEAGADGGDCEQ
jgi:hypothetical protein